MSKVGNPYHDPATGEFSAAPGGTLRASQLTKQGRAQLAARAQFKQVVSPHTKKVTGTVPSKVKSDEFFFINPTGKKGGSIKVYKYHDSPAAVALKTARALDRDFQAAEEKKHQADMQAAIAAHKGDITKYPMSKPTAKRLTPKRSQKGRTKSSKPKQIQFHKTRFY